MPTNRSLCFFVPRWLLGVIVLLPWNLMAQHSNILIGNYGETMMERYSILYPDSQFHSAVKPYTRSDVNRFIHKAFASDFRTEDIYQHSSGANAYNLQYLRAETSEFEASTVYGRDPVLGLFFKEPASLYQAEGDGYFVSVNPVIHTSFAGLSDSSGLFFENTRGIEVRACVDSLVSFHVWATDNQAQYPPYVKVANEGTSVRLAPGVGWSKSFKDTGYDFPYTRGYLAVDATKSIRFQLGHDKMFFGDGLRSLIWSDNSAPFWYFRLNTQFWKVNYQNNFIELTNFNQPKINVAGGDNRYRRKYAAFHQLSVNITPRFNVGIFETIIFQRNDSLGYTEGYDLQYLNPIIFYRAIEFGLGSPDNALLGFNWKYNFKFPLSIYGQFVLDELKFFELTGNTGWWGNKFGVQAGAKYINALGIENLDLQYEMNLVRPYMYTYDDENGSSYTHAGQALAHPLGANFVEHIAGLRYQLTPQITISNHLVMATRGRDTAGLNLGADIFANYSTRTDDYGIDLLQGAEGTLFMNDFMVSWQFWHNTFLEGRVVYRNADYSQIASGSNLMYSLGVRMNAALQRRWW